MAGDSASVPAQQGLWRDEPTSSLRSGQGRRDSTQQGPVLVGQLRSVVAAVQRAELVPWTMISRSFERPLRTASRTSNARNR